ncbi:MAG: hypothetical protein KDC07_09285 [Chitinophagaceae bacterium]|nr:hypothetical protein [Chitinophagaceae bacterium]MCB9047287.1 hypothetical protein [Chitinophagales bacterium]
MPVRIRIGDNSDDPRVISLQDYVDGRANFTLHYYYSPTQQEFGGQVIGIQWDDLQNAVDSFIKDTGTAATNVALRFVHCFMPGLSEAPAVLFLRLQICGMTPSAEPPPPGVSQVYDLDTTGALWYEISEGSFISTTDQTLFGTVYLSNFYYKADPASADLMPLTDGPAAFVKNLVLPWGNEILQMYLNNGSPAGAGINFAACSYVATPEHANVEWPHGMVVYLTNSTGQPMLDNDNYATIFHNKGADYGTMCPPNCNVYLEPDI